MTAPPIAAGHDLAPAAALSFGDFPPAAPIGFKEWAIICSALACGRQSVILRKGGIAEGRDGFRFKHEAFFLFPTQFHQQHERVRTEELPLVGTATQPPDGRVEIGLFFVLDFAVWIDDEQTVERLAPFHVWRPDVVAERFAYGDARGCQCAFGRVYRLTPTWVFEDRPAFGGCRSWLNLPEMPRTISYKPILADAAHAARRTAVLAALGDSAGNLPS